ncbi:hypothetical protein ES705_29060 [subsurface metagenome]
MSKGIAWTDKEIQFRDNKDYVPQAKQASNSAQALINLVKVQLDIIRHS